MIRAAAVGVLLGLAVVSPAQDAAWADSLEAYWGRMDAAFSDSGHSPLTEEDRATFVHLERYASDPDFAIMARCKPIRNGQPFTMKTSTTRMPTYVPAYRFTFKVDGKKCRLTAYRDPADKGDPKYHDYLFLPFTDLTNGETTYGGGRYLDLREPLGKEVLIDFNRAYNPYCAYSARYSCPIPPMENHLDARIEAGVKNFQGH